eukprot:gene25442-31072_t
MQFQTNIPGDEFSDQLVLYSFFTQACASVWQVWLAESAAGPDSPQPPFPPGIEPTSADLPAAAVSRARAADDSQHSNEAEFMPWLELQVMRWGLDEQVVPDYLVGLLEGSTGGLAGPQGNVATALALVVVAEAGSFSAQLSAVAEFLEASAPAGVEGSGNVDDDDGALDIAAEASATVLRWQAWNDAQASSARTPRALCGDGRRELPSVDHRVNSGIGEDRPLDDYLLPSKKVSGAGGKKAGKQQRQKMLPTELFSHWFPSVAENLLQLVAVYVVGLLEAGIGYDELQCDCQSALEEFLTAMLSQGTAFTCAAHLTEVTVHQ